MELISIYPENRELTKTFQAQWTISLTIQCVYVRRVTIFSIQQLNTINANGVFLIFLLFPIAPRRYVIAYQLNGL